MIYINHNWPQLIVCLVDASGSRPLRKKRRKNRNHHWGQPPARHVPPRNRRSGWYREILPMASQSWTERQHRGTNHGSPRNSKDTAQTQGWRIKTTSQGKGGTFILHIHNYPFEPFKQAVNAGKLSSVTELKQFFKNSQPTTLQSDAKDSLPAIANPWLQFFLLSQQWAVGIYRQII